MEAKDKGTSSCWAEMRMLRDHFWTMGIITATTGVFCGYRYGVQSVCVMVYYEYCDMWGGSCDGDDERLDIVSYHIISRRKTNTTNHHKESKKDQMALDLT